LFHGAHDPGKVRGVIELRIHPDVREVEPGDRVKFTVALFNQKTGHKFPTGSAEERLVWLHVEATDARGNAYHLTVDKKGFPGEEYTIAANTLAYQDMGIPLKIADFKGVQRDGIPEGDRIFRLPYLDPQGRMTITGDGLPHRTQRDKTRDLHLDRALRGPRRSDQRARRLELPEAAAADCRVSGRPQIRGGDHRGE
jgi:hypothetical protein